MIEFPARSVVIDHVFQRCQAPVVHVRSGHRDVPQRRRAKLADIGGFVGSFKEAAIRRVVGRNTGVEE